MKHNRHHDKAPSEGPQLMPVRFEFSHPTATRVFVAGSFNDWHPDSKPMHSLGSGHWVKDTALVPGTYEYCLVVDDQWMPDPLAKETIPNPFGGNNSVLRVSASTEATHLSDAEYLPMKTETQ